nr:MAG TPA: hypothetical protein [Caudoviricetes sp.]
MKAKPLKVTLNCNVFLANRFHVRINVEPIFFMECRK